MTDTTATKSPGCIIRGFYSEQISARESYRLPTERDPATGNLHVLSASVTDHRHVVDVSWLPAASEEYQISADIKDFVLVEVPIVEADVPNRNMHAFLGSRLLQFLPKYGVQAHKTFVGKPTFYEHDHEDNKKAKGVIFDAAIRRINGRTHVSLIKGFCRQKDPKLANDILTGKRRGHSMSAWANAFDCSVCAHHWDTSVERACVHARGVDGRGNQLAGLGKIHEGNKLCYAVVNGFCFFESSSVGDPANYAAHQSQQTTG